ncbi:MAG: hypothetical protein ACI9JN_000540 [Bacteroidia bacterium]|jgi:hypothetical protein
MIQTNEELMTTYFIAVADFMEAHPELVYDAFEIKQRIKEERGFLID